MNRLLAILLVLALSICCFAACGKGDAKDDSDKAPAYESQLEVEGGTLALETSVVDSTLYVSVIMEGNTGIAAFTLNLEYDNTKCVPREFIASDVLDFEEITSNIHQYADDYEGRAALTKASAFWATPSNNVENGVLYTLAFDVIDAGAEDFGLKLICEKDSFANENYEAVLFTVK